VSAGERRIGQGHRRARTEENGGKNRELQRVSKQEIQAVPRGEKKWVCRLWEETGNESMQDVANGCHMKGKKEPLWGGAARGGSPEYVAGGKRCIQARKLLHSKMGR